MPLKPFETYFFWTRTFTDISLLFVIGLPKIYRWLSFYNIILENDNIYNILCIAGPTTHEVPTHQKQGPGFETAHRYRWS